MGFANILHVEGHSDRGRRVREEINQRNGVLSSMVEYSICLAVPRIEGFSSKFIEVRN